MKHAGVVKIAQGKCIWCACALCPSVLDLVKPCVSKEDVVINGANI